LLFWRVRGNCHEAGGGLRMTGCVFKRKRNRSVSWCYVFFGGWDADGKRIQISKAGYPTKDAASKAVRLAIEEYEAKTGRITREPGARGRRVWSYWLDGACKSGFDSAAEAEGALREAIARRDVEKRKQAQDAADRPGPPFAQFFEHWLKEHASRRCAPKTMERYGELGAYLIRELGETRLNDLTTAQIQNAIHHLHDHGGRRTESEPDGRPLAPKTVRHMGTLLYTVLSDADRLGVLNIPHPMANRRVLLPKLAKRRPAVLDEAKLGTLFDRARNTRLYTFVILAAATGCRRGELLALQWSDLDFQTGLLDISKSLEQTRAGLRVKSTKSEEPRRVAVPEWALEVLKQHRAEQEKDRAMFGRDYANNDLIFCQPDGEYYSPDRAGARVAELMRKAGLQGVSLHSLRHSHASILLSKGVPISVVSERLGHADQNITLLIYSHALPADSRAAAKIWNDSMAEVVSSGPVGVDASKKSPACLPVRAF
jgi:integrase